MSKQTIKIDLDVQQVFGEIRVSKLAIEVPRALMEMFPPGTPPQEIQRGLIGLVYGIVFSGSGEMQ